MMNNIEALEEALDGLSSVGYLSVGALVIVTGRESYLTEKGLI